MSFLSKPYQIFLDRALDIPGHGKYVVDGFNAVHKQYLATCLKMRSTPEAENIYSKRMRVESIRLLSDVLFIKIISDCS